MSTLRRMSARYRGRCGACKATVTPGQVIYYDRSSRRLRCEACGAAEVRSSGDQPPPLPRPPAQLGRKYALGLIAVLIGLFCIGLLSDRIWLATVYCMVLCAIASSRAANTRRPLLGASLAFFLLTAGSLTRDMVDGGLFDHPPSALCADGTYSYSEHRRGTCSWHHGVATWNPKVPWWRRM
jgi:ribosomal protein S27E